MRRLGLSVLLFLLINSCAKIKIKDSKTFQPPSNNWTMNSGDIYRTNRCFSNIQTPLKLHWRKSFSAAIGKTILASDGLIFFSTMDGNVFAYDIETGKKIGRQKTEIHSTTALQKDFLFVARRYGNNTLFRYDLKKGKSVWGINAGDISSEPLLLENSIVVTALYSHIDKYNALTGERIWQTKTDGHIHSSPASDGETIIFGCDDGFIYAVKNSTGEIMWKYETKAAVQAMPLISNDVVYVGTNANSYYALTVKTGERLWEFPTDGKILNGSAISDSTIIFGSTDSHIYCLNRFTGDLLWLFDAGSVISTSPLVCGDVVYFGSLDRHLYALDLGSGQELWKYKAKGRIRTAPIVWSNYLIFASENNNVYVFRSARENVD